MDVDRDYGSKYIDFLPAAGTSRPGPLHRKVLAKDVGVADEGADSPALTPMCRAASRGGDDGLVAAAATAGALVAVPAAGSDGVGHAGVFSDPDGFAWKVSAVWPADLRLPGSRRGDGALM